MNEEIITGVISTVAGCVIIIFRTYFNNIIIEAQRHLWGINFDAKEMFMSKLAIVITGIFAIAFGLGLIGFFF